MTTATPIQRGFIPALTLAQRLTVARETTGMNQGDFGDAIGVSKSTIQRYEAGRVDSPKKTLLMAYALATGVDYTWIATGTGDSGPDGDGGSRLGESNPRPIHYE